MANKVKLKTLVEKMNLKNLTPDVDLSEKEVEIPDINRPALQLTGFFEHFDSERVQIIGYVEYTFLEKMTDEVKKKKIYETLLSYKIPCLIFCRNLPPEAMLLEMAEKANIPVFQTEKKTSEFTAEIIRWLNVELAPCISIHGVLVDVYGVGVLIMGESGIGKSEAALELIKRGHRLVSDDVVEIRRVSDETLVGTAPDITRHFIELRGIGIVDVKALFGVLSVRETQNIDLVITLEEWNKNTTASVSKKNIQNSLVTKWFAIICQFVLDVILQSLLRRQQLTTDRNRWDIMQLRNCTNVFSRI